MELSENFRRYIISGISIVLVLLIVTGAVNWIMNPFGIYDTPVIERINSTKPAVDDYSRIYKAYRVTDVDPNTIILGSSVAWMGIDPGHPAWDNHPVYNLAVNSATIYEIARYLQHAQNDHPLTQVFILLSFYAFNSELITAPDFEETYLNVDYQGEKNSFSRLHMLHPTLLSHSALWNSLVTLAANVVGWERYKILENGMQIQVNPPKIDYPDIFEKSVQSFIRPNTQYEFINSDEESIPFEALRDIIRIAHENNIELCMIMSPLHVYHYESLALRDLWQEFETWKRKCVMINTEESRAAGKDPFPLWDFANYNPYTTEDVPTAENTDAVMKSYNDSAHFTIELGDKVLDRVYGVDSNVPETVVDFGVILSEDNIDEHLLIVRQAREQYANTHPDDIKIVENIIEDYYSKSQR